MSPTPRSLTPDCHAYRDVWNCVSCKLLSLTSRCHARHGVTPVGMIILRSLLRSFVFSTPHRRVWNRDVPHAHAHCTVHTAEKEWSNYVHEYLVNIETVFENILTCFSRARWGFRTKKLVSLYITFNKKIFNFDTLDKKIIILQKAKVKIYTSQCKILHRTSRMIFKFCFVSFSVPLFEMRLMIDTFLYKANVFFHSRSRFNSN